MSGARRLAQLVQRRVVLASPLPALLGLVLLGSPVQAQATASSPADWLEQARQLDASGDPLAARARYDQALQRAETELGDTSPALALLLEEVGLVYQRTGEDGHAETLHRRALAVLEGILGPDHPDLVPQIGTLASLLTRRGPAQEAEALYRRALTLLEIQRSANPPPSPDEARQLASQVAAVLGHLGNLALRGERLDEARQRYEQAIRVGGEAGPQAGDDLAVLHNNLAALELRRGQAAAAANLYRRAIELAESTLGPHHPAVGFSLDQLAALYLDRGEVDLALPLAERALAIAERHAPPTSPEVTSRRRLIETLRSGLQGVLPDPPDTAIETAVDNAPPDSADTPSTAPSGPFWAQVASRPRREDAEQEVDRLRAAHPEILARTTGRVLPAQVEGRGQWFRVQWGGFADEAAAAALCQALRGVGLDCLVWRAP